MTDRFEGQVITEPMKANWAIASITVQHKKELTKALKKAYVDPAPDQLGAVPERENILEVRKIGENIVKTCDRALEFLDS